MGRFLFHLAAMTLSIRRRTVAAWMITALATLSVSGQTVYWDRNGNTAGASTAPSGTWVNSGAASHRNWSTSSAGTSNTARWNDNSTAIFSAGTDATGSYTVTVSGTINVGGITVEEGTPAFTGGAISFNSGSSLVVGSTLSWGTTTFTNTGTLNIGGGGVLDFTQNQSIGGTVNLSGGTLRLSDAAVSFATLNITGNTIIDFAGSASSLSLTNFSISGGATLTIVNWQSAVDLFTASSWTGAVVNTNGVAPMNQVVFTGWDMGTGWTDTGEIRPIPEPSTYGAMLTGALAAFFLWRRHRRRG